MLLDNFTQGPHLTVALVHACDEVTQLVAIVFELVIKVTQLLANVFVGLAAGLHGPAAGPQSFQDAAQDVGKSIRFGHVGECTTLCRTGKPTRLCWFAN